MSDDLLVIPKFKNLRLFELAEPHGGIAGLARAIPMHRTRIDDLVNLRALPWTKDGTPTVAATLLCEFSLIDFEELFPVALYQLSLPDEVRRTFNSTKILSLEAAREQRLLPEVAEPSDDNIFHSEMRAALLAAFSYRGYQQLTEREERVLRLRFGIDDGEERSLSEIANEFGVGAERVRQIEAKALRKMRHPAISKSLRPFTPTEGK